MPKMRRSAVAALPAMLRFRRSRWPGKARYFRPRRQRYLTYSSERSKGRTAGHPASCPGLRRTNRSRPPRDSDCMIAGVLANPQAHIACANPSLAPQEAPAGYVGESSSTSSSSSSDRRMGVGGSVAGGVPPGTSTSPGVTAPASLSASPRCLFRRRVIQVSLTVVLVSQCSTPVSQGAPRCRTAPDSDRHSAGTWDD